MGNQIKRITMLMLVGVLTPCVGLAVTACGSKVTVTVDDSGQTNNGGNNGQSSPILSSLTLNANPDKYSYYVGEFFDPTGMIVYANYTNADSKIITGLLTYKKTALTLDDSGNFPLSYTEGDITKTTTVGIYVTEIEVEQKVTVHWFNESVEMLTREFTLNEDYNNPYSTYTGNEPTKTASETTEYTFFEWEFDQYRSGQYEYYYTAVFAESTRLYVWNFYDENMNLLYYDTAEYEQIPTPMSYYLQEAQQYTYSWERIDGEYAFKRIATLQQYSIEFRWTDLDGLHTENALYDYGTTPTAPILNDDVKFHFSGLWYYLYGGTEIVPVTQNAYYTAVSSVKEYLVTWEIINPITSEIILNETESYGYGATPNNPADTFMDTVMEIAGGLQTVDTSYFFNGWSNWNNEIIEDVIYTANWTGGVRQYTVTWQNTDGTTGCKKRR